MEENHEILIAKFFDLNLEITDGTAQRLYKQFNDLKSLHG